MTHVNIMNNMLVKTCYKLNGLNCYFANARGLISKLDVLRYIAVEKDLHVIGIAETFLHHDINNNEISVTGYKIYRKDRNNFKPGKGGGVVMYIREDIVSFDFCVLNSNKCESVWCKIKTNNKREIAIGTCYRSQLASETEIQELFKTISIAANTETLIMGDFNFPGINWKLMQSDATANEFFNLIQDCFLHQHVLEATREQNILDLVLTSHERMIDGVVINEHLGSSDHNSLIFKLNFQPMITTTKKLQRNYYKANFHDMQIFFQGVKWEIEFLNMNVNEKWARFCEIIGTAVEKYVPFSSWKRKKVPKWMNRNTIRARHSKVKLWKRYKLSKSYNDYVEYRRAQNRAIKEYRKAKLVFEKKLALDIKKNPKNFYAYVKSKTVVKENVGPLKDDNGEMITDPSDLGNCLNNFFGSMFTDEMMTDIPEVKTKFNVESSHILQNVNLEMNEVKAKLKNLNITKSPGIDSIHPIILVNNADELTKPIYEIFCDSLSSGEVPKEWKLANVTPIYKSGARDLSKNYRPISLTSQICKILESIIKDRITEHLDRYGLINSTQHGFVRHKSCLTNLLEFYEYTSKYIDQGLPVDVIYLDFQKAFDKVPHERLLLKVKAMGIHGQIYYWIKNWLQNRQQRVVISGVGSDWINVKSGVPQGSVLGPLLFLIYINDIDDCVNNMILKFADDTKLFGTVANQSDIDKLQQDLRNLCRWSKEWLMLFNVDKCKVMHFGSKNVQANYDMDGIILQNVDNEKDLGVTFQNDLKWNRQCTKTANTANRILGMIKRSFSYLDINSFLHLYKSLVRPHLDYCVQVWRPYLHKDIDLLEKVQKRATKLVPALKDKPYEERLVALNLTTLETRRIRGDLIETFKILKGIDNIAVKRFFTLSNVHNTRGHSLKLFKLTCNLDVRKYSLAHRVVNIWNSLTDEVIACDSITSFKSRLDKFLKGRGLI